LQKPQETPEVTGCWAVPRGPGPPPRPSAGRPAESTQLTDLAGSGWSTGRSLDGGRSAREL